MQNVIETTQFQKKSTWNFYPDGRLLAISSEKLIWAHLNSSYSQVLFSGPYKNKSKYISKAERETLTTGAAEDPSIVFNSDAKEQIG